ncbi:MAG: fumarate/nitrate reduction transcriptional regulator Fnr [Burkholderiaceae bacterium]
MSLAAQLKSACATCSLHDLCVPSGMSQQELAELDELVANRVRIRRGESLFRVGDPFENLYAIRVGSFKSRLTTVDGREQITGFQMPGEVLGFDGVASDHHSVDAVALIDSEACVMPYADLERIARNFEPLHRRLHRIMSREIVRDQSVMLLLGTMRAEERVAIFLLSLSQRFSSLGFSAIEFVLTMTRAEIGNFLGLKLETISRAMSRLQQDDVLRVEGRSIAITDMSALRSLANEVSAKRPG